MPLQFDFIRPVTVAATAAITAVGACARQTAHITSTALRVLRDSAAAHAPHLMIVTASVALAAVLVQVVRKTKKHAPVPPKPEPKPEPQPEVKPEPEIKPKPKSPPPQFKNRKRGNVPSSGKQPRAGGPGSTSPNSPPTPPTPPTPPKPASSSGDMGKDRAELDARKRRVEAQEKIRTATSAADRVIALLPTVRSLFRIAGKEEIEFLGKLRDQLADGRILKQYDTYVGEDDKYLPEELSKWLDGHVAYIDELEAALLGRDNSFKDQIKAAVTKSVGGYEWFRERLDSVDKEIPSNIENVFRGAINGVFSKVSPAGVKRTNPKKLYHHVSLKLHADKRSAGGGTKNFSFELSDFNQAYEMFKDDFKHPYLFALMEEWLVELDSKHTSPCAPFGADKKPLTAFVKDKVKPWYSSTPVAGFGYGGFSSHRPKPPKPKPFDFAGWRKQFTGK